MGHPYYSPGLAPNNVWMYPNIKSALKGRRFQDTEDLQKNVTMALKTLPKQEF